MLPATPDEALLADAIGNLDVVKVPRAPADQLAWARMKPRECHANCQFYVNNDPERKTRMMFGWTLDTGVYVLHSVIERDGQIICITPNELDETSIDFRPDPDLVAKISDQNKFSFSRTGIKVEGYGVRPDPAKTIKLGKYVKKRLLSGMNPYEAIKLPDTW